MTTAAFIKMLQDADPSGTAHIRLGDGVPLHAELKEGYWDGPYSFIDEEGNYNYTTMGMKVDLYCVDIFEFVERNMNIHDPENWEKIKNKFRFSLTYCVKEHRDEREGYVLKEAREAYDDIYKIHKDSYDRSYDEMKANSKKGWTWFQNKDVDKNVHPNMHVYYTWKVFDETGKSQNSNIHNTESIQKSGVWVKCDNNIMDGYYQWIYNTDENEIQS